MYLLSKLKKSDVLNAVVGAHEFLLRYLLIFALFLELLDHGTCPGYHRGQDNRGRMVVHGESDGWDVGDVFPGEGGHILKLRESQDFSP